MRAFRIKDGTEVHDGEEIRDTLGDRYVYRGVAEDSTEGNPGWIRTPQGRRKPGAFGLEIRDG